MTPDLLAIPAGFRRIDSGRLYHCPYADDAVEIAAVEMESITDRAVWINCVYMDALMRGRSDPGYDASHPHRHLVALDNVTAVASGGR